MPDILYAPTFPRKAPRGKRYVREVTVVPSSADLQVIHARVDDIEAALLKTDHGLKRGVEKITVHSTVIR